ncbi:MAG: DSD1 family PLP-dependent enzyme [Planctomycetota bacterium]|nr:MAG: DSD1 family PLP-dependent enzyme [Planctomycetota bacterium]REK26923.1 MAG: DSD1 family PLP-dependent enzyme [Planctomycetota bacterium]REK35412.1 MAG: DSD1 family PLP-dependent enzyme [Planctomycetota bacterium]
MNLSAVGLPQAALDTPAYCIDLDVMEANIAAMAAHMRERKKDWRPHAKCHKTPAIAHKQLAAGAIGVTVAKVSEAEVYAAAGIRDILIANMLFGEPKFERVAALCRHADPIVACDHFAQAEGLAAVCTRRGVTCRMVIEVDIGLNRVGIRPGPDFLDLARGISKLEGVRLAGVMGYEGHLLRVEDPDEKRQKIDAAMALLVEQRDQMVSDGLNCEIVSAGGTGSYQYSADCPGITEMQAGGGIFADPYYVDAMGLKELRSSLRVLATVVSRPSLERAVTDTGRKTIHPDLAMPVARGRVNGRPLTDAVFTGLSAEHGVLKLGPDSQDLQIGDKIEVIPGYTDFTTVLHEHFYGLRNGVVETVWPIAARGKLQ